MLGFHVSFWNCNILAVSIGKKRKEQHDANQAAMGLNPAYNGAYGATPQVSRAYLLVPSLIFYRCIESIEL